jgi:hypothetical protein
MGTPFDVAWAFLAAIMAVVCLGHQLGTGSIPTKPQ